MSKTKSKSAKSNKSKPAKSKPDAPTEGAAQQFRRFILRKGNDGKSFSDVYDAFIGSGGELAKSSAYVVFCNVTATVELLKGGAR